MLNLRYTAPTCYQCLRYGVIFNPLKKMALQNDQEVPQKK